MNGPVRNDHVRESGLKFSREHATPNLCSGWADGVNTSPIVKALVIFNRKYFLIMISYCSGYLFRIFSVSVCFIFFFKSIFLIQIFSIFSLPFLQFPRIKRGIFKVKDQGGHESLEWVKWLCCWFMLAFITQEGLGALWGLLPLWHKTNPWEWSLRSRQHEWKVRSWQVDRRLWPDFYH